MKEIFATNARKEHSTVPVESRALLTASASRLAAGYRSIPALASARTWSEIEAVVAEERAARAAAHNSPATR